MMEKPFSVITYKEKLSHTLEQLALLSEEIFAPKIPSPPPTSYEKSSSERLLHDPFKKTIT
jgi:hypothetical protein